MTLNSVIHIWTRTGQKTLGLGPRNDKATFVFKLDAESETVESEELTIDREVLIGIS